MQNVLSKSPVQKFNNAVIVDEIEVLNHIHQEEKNIAIYQRSVDHLASEIALLLGENLKIRISGKRAEVLHQLKDQLSAMNLEVPLFLKDATELVEQFEEISGAPSFRLFLSTVSTNMCRRFHTDINDLRLLCTYSGQGTLWLPDEAVDRELHHHGGANEEILVKPKLVQQAKAGDVLILKGALYPKAEAAIHRSPSIEESDERRLLLRIDTNEFANFG